MHCWNQLNLNYSDILEVDKDSLCSNIIKNQSYNTGDPYTLFFIRTKEILKFEFIKFLDSKNLIPMPFSVGFLVKPNTKGFVHRDYYMGGETSEFDGVPYKDDLTPKIKHLLNDSKKHKYWFANLHLHIGISGSLFWYDGDSEEIYEKTKLNIPIYRYNNDENLTIVDTMNHPGISICKTDILHRSSNLDNTKLRVVVTMRFAGNPTFNQLKEKLGDLVIERE